MEPKYQRDQFDFDTFKAFSGLVIRKPLANEAQLIAIHEYVIDKGCIASLKRREQ